MAGAGFYSIHTQTLTFRSDGRWYADDEPVTHPRLAQLFSRHLRRKPGGGYEIWIDDGCHADVSIEDTPYVITGVERHADGITITLNDGSAEALEATTLRVGANHVLYACVKGGTESARFVRSAYYQLTNAIEEHDGRFHIHCGRRTHVIAQD